MAMSKTSKILLLIGGILFVFLLVGIIAVAIIAERLSRPELDSNSALILSVSGDLPDYVPEEPLTRAFGIQPKQSFTSLLTQLRKAKIDNRISGVILDINFPGIGWGKADELRDAIKDYRSSGKPAYAYMQIGS